MIVTCERCDTEFQLDDARVPEAGARVRCSRCKHAFFVSRPSAAPPAESSEELFDHAAESALAASETPDVTQDLPDEREQGLFGELPRDRDEAPPEPDESPSESDESDWQFNSELPADTEEPAPPRARAQAPASEHRRRATDRPREPEPEPEPAAPAEELGSPAEWDIFDDVAAAPAAPVAAEPAPRATAPRRVYPGYDVERVGSSGDPASPIVQRIVSGVGWLATAGLFAIAVWHGLVPARVAETAWPVVAPGVALEGVRVRWLENLHVGGVYVVSGQLRNESPSAFVALPSLELELRDGSGRPVGKSFPIAATRAPDRLREADAAELTAEADLGGALRGGETRAFEIVAWPLPPEAERFAIRPAGPRS